MSKRGNKRVRQLERRVAALEKAQNTGGKTEITLDMYSQSTGSAAIDINNVVNKEIAQRAKAKEENRKGLWKAILGL